MKKTGKYERKPKTGDLLLQTYFTSMVSLILCVSMFFGTSYAWFTSEVTNTQNEIYVGTLAVGLYKGTECTTANDMSKPEGPKLFDKQIRWEPGYTALETITVKNEGDLAFHYVMNFIEATESNNEATENNVAETEATESTATEKNTTGQVDLDAVAKMFEVYVFNHRANTYKTPTSYGDITASGSGWTRIGTLAEVLDGKVVLDGNMVTVRQNDKDDDPTTSNDTDDGVPTVDTYTIALHMKESATGSVMGQKISLNVKLVAYQHSSENDVFGNPNYDTVTTVTNADELKKAFKNGGIISLAADIVAKDIETLGAIYDNKSVDIYLNGHDITATLAEDGECNSTELFYVGPGCKLTIHGDDSSKIHVNAARSQKVSAVINNCGGTVVINGGNYSMTYGSYDEDYLIPTIIDNNSTLGAATVTINGGTFKHGRNMFRNFSNNATAPAKLVINGGTFNGEDGEFKNGTIWNQKPNASMQTIGGLVEINGGTYKGMRVCTGFGNTGETSGVKAAGNVALGEWGTDGSAEWIANISNNTN